MTFHPAKIIPYVPTPKKEKYNREEFLCVKINPLQGIPLTHKQQKTTNNKKGLKKKIKFCLNKGSKASFERSFTPSETGCKIPANVNLFGPNRT